MAAPITDTVAVYQVHGIRFAVPEGLVPVTDKYILTDLKPDAWPDTTPHNSITLFTDPGSPQEILDDYMSASDGIHDGPHLHNLRRQRIGDRMFTRASITYTPYVRKYSDETGDRVRIDYAFTVDKASGMTWGFGLIPPDTTLTPTVAQDWLDMLQSVAPKRKRPGSTDASPLRIGFDRRQEQRLFHTPWYTIHVPASWRTINSFLFKLEDLPSSERLRAKNIDAIDEAHISVSTEFVPYDKEQRTVEELQRTFDSFGDGPATVESRTLDGYPVEWFRFGPDPGGRVKYMSRVADILLHKNKQDGQVTTVDAGFEYIIYTTTEDSAPPDEREKLMGKYFQLYNSIKISY